MKAVAAGSRSASVPARSQQKADRRGERTGCRPLWPVASLSDVPTIQRKSGCACGGGCPGCEAELDEGRIQQSGAIGEGEQEAANHLNAGQPLPVDTRAYFEPRFGHDFTHVRIHTGPSADDSARRIHALAYATGQDVVFRSGQYEPETTRGKRLLAHELAHVVQQGTGAPSIIRRQNDPESPEP